jgi:predicted Rossmann fold flavoprotein
MPSLVVVGGGAAGVFAAITAREANRRLDVTVLESLPQLLSKVKISGGGRCNVTHHCFDVDRLVTFYPRGGRELRGVFRRFGPSDVVRWFTKRGVALKTEDDGRMFPVSDESQTIIDCLLQAASRARVALRTRVKAVDLPAADFVLLASGSSPSGYRLAASCGHSLVAPVPSLFTFNVSDERLGGLAGVSMPSVRGRLSVGNQPAVVQDGPLLITHWGLSGPVVLRLSAWGARPLHASQYHGQLWIDFFPALQQDEVRARLLAQKQATPRKLAVNEGPLPMPKRLWERLLAHDGIEARQAWGDVSKATLGRLAESLKRSTFEVRGKGVFKDEFVTAGGVPLAEVDLKTMQSKKRAGLYLAGEILDVDALTGGFNFQNAWSTGWIAGTAIAAAAG